MSVGTLAGPESVRPAGLAAGDALAEIGSRARSLWERLADLPAREAPPEELPRRLASWARVVARGDLPTLERRLGWEGIDPRRAAAALDSTPGPTAIPAWTARLAAHAELAAEIGAGAREAARRRLGPAVEAMPFVELLWPWVELAAAALAREAGAALASFAPAARADLERGLLGDLANLSDAAVYELFVERRDAEPAEGFLGRFLRDLLADPLGRLYLPFPALARQTCRRVETWIDAGAELARRLAGDRAALAALLAGGTDPGPVEAIAVGLSDRHRGGRQVARLRFRSGLELIYKPRSTAPEAAWAGFLGWCADHGLVDAPPAARTLARADYGWMEAVSPQPLGDPAAAAAYHRRAGALVALAYALGAEDLHAENLVATALGPVAVDLEVVVQPVRERLSSGEEGDDGVGAGGDESTVLASGLLLRALPGAPPGGAAGGLWPVVRRRPCRRWLALGTDGLRGEAGEESLPAFPNVPRLDGVELEPSRFADDLVGGFESAWRFLVAQRPALLDHQGPLAAFAGLTVRTVVRPSQDYGRVVQLAALPRNQRSGLAASWLIEALAASLVESEDDEAAALWPLVLAERAALEAGDVPWLGVSTVSTAVEVAGRQPVEGLFALAGLEAVRRRLAALDEAGLARETTRLRAVLSREPLPAPLAGLAAATAGDPAACRRAAAAELGRVVRSALAAGDRPAATLAPDLGQGRLGIVLFLAALARAGDRDDASDSDNDAALEREVAALGRDLADEATLARLPVGGFAGLGSLGWGLAWLARLLPGLAVGDAEARVRKALARRLDDPAELGFDVEGGTAGAVLGLLALGALDDARRAGERLLASQRATGSASAAWPNRRGLAQVGFAHGAAGAARALAALATAGGDPRFLVGATAALGHERRLYDPRRGAWPVQLVDSRGRRRGRRYPSSWCRGAPGIALARLYLPAALRDPPLAAELAIALELTAEAPASPFDHLCCGELGRASVLQTAAQRTGGGRWRETAERRATAAVARLATTRELPLGLLQGVAGAGYQLLRLDDPGLPDVLALELPSERPPERSSWERAS